jgi:hypothetical protein
MGRTSQRFDRQLFTFKLSEELSPLMQKESVASNKAAFRGGNGPAKLGGSVLVRIVGGQLVLLREWLRRVDRIAREVWQTQGEPITPEFVRDILVPEALTLIGARESAIKGMLTRTRREGPYPAQHHLALEIRKLKTEVANRYEIEAREFEYKTARAERDGAKSQLDWKSQKRSRVSIPPPVQPVNTSLTVLTAVRAEGGEKKQEKKQSTQLPANLRHAGDPVDGNPFPADDVRHKIWQKATLNAEEEVCRVNSEFLKRSPTGQQGFVEWLRQGKVASAAQYFAASTLALCVAKFDIWAKRGIQIVWSENAVQAYDQWLFNFAQGWLDAQEESGHLPYSALLDFRSRLIERVEYWKAEARRYLSEQRKEVDRLRTGEEQAESFRAQNNAKSTQGVEAKSRNSAATTEKSVKRLSAMANSPIAAKKMEVYLDAKSIGLTDFAASVGTTDRTLRSFRKTGKVRRDIFESIAKQMGTTKEDLLGE